MKTRNHCFLTAAAIVAGVTLNAGLAAAQQPDGSEGPAVFVMTNNADHNEVIAFPRTEYGTLLNPVHVRTGGRGSGGTVDPLASQGSFLHGARRHRDARAQVILIDRMAGGTCLVKGFAMDRIANGGG